MRVPLPAAMTTTSNAAVIAMFPLLPKIIRQRARWSLWLVLGMALALGGCSVVRVGYNQAPLGLYWWLDNQVGWRSEQAPVVRQALQQLQQWHRQEELPIYAQTLAQWGRQAQGALDEVQVCEALDAVQARTDRLMREAIRLAAPVVPSIDAAQRQQLQRRLAERNRDWRKEWLDGTPEQRLQRRVQRTSERYAEWYGRLSPAQLALVRQQLESSSWSAQWAADVRLQRQQALLQLLEAAETTPLSPEQVQAALWQQWQAFSEPPQEADVRYMRGWLRQACGHLAEFHNSTSAQQRAHLTRKLASYEQDLRALGPR